MGYSVLVVVLLLIALPSYLVTRQHNIAIAPYIRLLNDNVYRLSSSFIVCLVLYAQDYETGLLPVSLASWVCCKGGCCSCCKDCNSCCDCCKIINVVSYTIQPVVFIAVFCFAIKHHAVEFESKIILKNCEDGKSIVLNYTDLVTNKHKTCCGSFQEKELKKDCTCSYFYQWILNLLGLTLTFCLVSYVLQALPNILIAYYSYPSKSLVRLSFLQIALACLVTNVAGIIFLLEKLGWQCCVWKNKGTTPQDIQDFEVVMKGSVNSTNEEYTLADCDDEETST